MKTKSLAVVGRGFAVMVALSWISLSPNSWAQIVQIPSMGTFNISGSMAVPDRGTGFMGGNASGIGSTAPGAIGRSTGVSGASVSTTVIDLDELDKMIRSQASSATSEPTLKQFDPTGYSRLPAKPKGRAAPAGYDYLAALSGDSPDKPHVSGYGSVLHETDSDATKYYLNLANLARQRGHWASVETYYRLAWQSLPQSRRETALRSLEKSRAKASQERVMLKGQMPSKSASNSR
ncbi:MAG: hypothetical protein LW850_28945 [Planctomycetaceae bacterium]|jgi:hypothetical protein|nr:hypothetical protein [Planctomycetaceae bacterium]MCE2814433.1 hypothetical protein [Planctomycetaceae bacterium]